MPIFSVEKAWSFNKCQKSSSCFRFDAGSPDSVTHREQDFGYEVIEQDDVEPLQHFDKVPEKFLQDLQPTSQPQLQQPVLAAATTTTTTHVNTSFKMFIHTRRSLQNPQ